MIFLSGCSLCGNLLQASAFYVNISSGSMRCPKFITRKISMDKKKIFAVFVALIVAVCCVFAACSAKKADSDAASSYDGTSQYTNETYTTTDPAQIKGGEAAQLIQSYSTEELGLPESWDKYDSVAVNDSGIKLENSDYAGYYIEVEVSKKYDIGDDKFTFDNVGTYLISYDGKTLLKYDEETGECTPIEMKEVSAASSGEGTASGETHTHENGEVHAGAAHAD